MGRRSWWRLQMETFSALLALCAGNSPVTCEFPSQRLVTRIFDVFFDLRLNKRLSKQSRHRWSKTPSHSLWRHWNVFIYFLIKFQQNILQSISLGTLTQYFMLWLEAEEWIQIFCCLYMNIFKDIRKYTHNGLKRNSDWYPLWLKTTRRLNLPNGEIFKTSGDLKQRFLRSHDDDGKQRKSIFGISGHVTGSR